MTTRFSTMASALAAAAASLLPLALSAADAAAESGIAPGRTDRPHPADARAEVPPVGYRSAFSGYRPLGDAKVGWRQANDEVGRIGGWRTYARQANGPEPSSSAPRADAPHGGHVGRGSHGTPSTPGEPGTPEPAASPKHGRHGSHGDPEGRGAHGKPKKN